MSMFTAEFELEPVDVSGSTVWPSELSLSPTEREQELQALLDAGAKTLVRDGVTELPRPVYVQHQDVRLISSGGSIILFTDNERGGFRSYNADKVVITNISFNHITKADYSFRTHFGAGLIIDECSDVTLINVGAVNSTAAGILLNQCSNVVAKRLRTHNTLADGVHFNNCNNVDAESIWVTRCGDDGLAFVDYKRYANGRNFKVKNVSITESGARGITCIGAADGIIENYEVIGSAVHSILIETDLFYDSYRPAYITLKNGVTSGAGTLTRYLQGQVSTLKSFGLAILNADEIMIENLSIAENKDGGIYVEGCRNITLTALSGAESIANDGSRVIKSKAVRLKEVMLINAGSFGLLMSGVSGAYFTDVSLTCANAGAVLSVFDGGQDFRSTRNKMYISINESLGKNVTLSGNTESYLSYSSSINATFPSGTAGVEVVWDSV